MVIKEALNIIESITVIFASVSAIIGILIWKKQIVFQKRHQVSAEILETAFDCLDQIKEARSGRMRPDVPSYRSVANDEKEIDPAIIESADRAYYPASFLKLHEDKFIKREALGVQARIHIGGDIEKNILEILAIRKDILRAADRSSIRMIMSAHSKSVFEESRSRDDRVLTKNRNSTDELDKEIEIIKNSLSKACNIITPLI